MVRLACLSLWPTKPKVTPMITALGLGLASLPQPTGEVFVPLTTISISNFSRDRTLFDSGAAFGRSEAVVPVSGTGTEGETIELRLAPEGQTPTAWADFATVDGAGNWQGEVTVLRQSDWLRVEVRMKSEPVTRAMTSNRFGVGHVIALWGQSEVVRIRSTVYNQVTPEPLLDDDSVQAMWFDGGPVVKHLSNADSHTAALAAMANVFMAERSGDKVALVFQAVSGTGFRDLVDDSNASRSWADEAALHSFATADGQHVGLPSVSWFASPGSFAEHYEDALFPLFTGKTAAGAPVSFPSAISYNGTSSYQADHWFGELYDEAHTRWVAFGPHKFDIGADMRNATVLLDGSPQSNLENKAQARESWRAMVANPNANGLFLPPGLEPLTYQNGVDDGQGGWSDQSHPASDSDDGAPMFARLMAHAILQSAGLTNWVMPVFNQSDWEPSGGYVDIWSNAGAITTPRIKRGLPALGSDYPHWTEVFGWQINGEPAQRAEIIAGRVRLYPNEASFVASDVIQFGEGGATGMVKFPEDHQAQTYLNLPIVDAGLSGIDGVPLRPLIDAAVVQNPLVPMSSLFTTGATGPFFYDPDTLGAGVERIAFQFDMAAGLPSSGTKMLMTSTGNYLRLESLANGRLRLRVRDSGGAVHVDYVQTAAGVVADGVQADIRLSIDLPAGFARLWVNGAQVLNESFTSTAPTLPSNRRLLLLANSTGSNQVEGDITRVAVWKDAVGDNGLPAQAPYKDIVGPASVVNADSWKQGDNAS